MDEREGGGERPRVSGAENSVTTDNWKRTTDVYANDPPYPFVNDPFFSLCQIFEALEEDLSTFIHGVTSHVSDIT